MNQGFDAVTARLVLALARDGSIGRTAARENIAPSAVSRRISELEARLGIALFDRLPQGMVPTAAGRIYAAGCRRIMRRILDLDAEMQAISQGRSGLLRIAATTSALSGRAPEVLAEFARLHPDIRLELEEMPAVTNLAALEDARVDIAILPDNHDMSAFDTEPFDDDRVYVIAPSDHALASSLKASRPVAFSDMPLEEMVGFHENGALDRLLTEAARKLGRQLGTRIRAESFSALVRLVEAGFGIGFVRATALHLLAGTDVASAPLSDAWAGRFQLIACRRTSQPNPSVEAFRALARHGAPVPARP
ncbi:LysR family transcriptional regulator [Aureimonas altamirensis]|uniref:LysR family transcriptional regulator n=1 Tax=Aureimonas altamirensis TaxID=370622 RepID=UPI002036DCB9|nr:LysR substrate-binding domain-containing protein [Aureimonas altamirensis]MCM2505578.1 LysR family transcriptional regulator [Aureimonas altamirensis]